MSPKQNPLKINALQLRTLTLLQALAELPGARETAEGDVVIVHLPTAHGDHFHLGDAVVASRDATGLANEAVWNALARKGLARSNWPRDITVTKAGLAYETGLAEEILRPGGHH